MTTIMTGENGGGLIAMMMMMIMMIIMMIMVSRLCMVPSEVRNDGRTVCRLQTSSSQRLQVDSMSTTSSPIKPRDGSV